jgi:tetratricopeptide (TPR) repeat protein
MLFSNKGKEAACYIKQLCEDSDIPEKHDQDPKFSQIVLRLHQMDKLNNLFIIQKPLIDIQNRVLKSTETSKSLTVYLAKIISNTDLEMIRSESDKFISIGIFVLATKSLLTARTIARKMADNGLLSILFQIEVAEGIRLLEIDSDHVIFRLGTVFHFESINQAPDDVWYVKIKSGDSEFRVIKERLQLEIDVPLSWLTYGNYLYFLKQPQLAETYFEFLLKKLPVEHVDRLSIYNNMALIYTMENGKDGKTKATEIYDDALKCAQSVKSDLRITEYKDQACIAIRTLSETFQQTNFDRSTVLGSIADVYYQKGDYKLALDHYKQALASSTDSQCRSYYQHIIATVTKCIKET